MQAAPPSLSENDLKGDELAAQQLGEVAGADIWQAIFGGDPNPAALERINYGSMEGTPIAYFQDDTGHWQYLELSTTDWMAQVETRDQQRTQRALYERQQRELEKLRNEHRPAFDHGLDTLGDDPILRALLLDLYERDPRHALGMILDIQYAENADADAAANMRQTVTEGLAFDQTKATSGQTTKLWQQHIADRERALADNALGGGAEWLARQTNTLERDTTIISRGASWKPSHSSQTQLSPAQAYDVHNAAQMYYDWLELLDTGIPGGPQMSIPNPQDMRSFGLKEPELLSNLQGLANSLGWTVPMGQEDIVALGTALTRWHGIPAGEQGLDSPVAQFPPGYESPPPPAPYEVKAAEKQQQSIFTQRLQASVDAKVDQLRRKVEAGDTSEESIRAAIEALVGISTEDAAVLPKGYQQQKLMELVELLMETVTGGVTARNELATGPATSPAASGDDEWPPELQARSPEERIEILREAAHALGIDLDNLSQGDLERLNTKMIELATPQGSANAN